LGPIIAIIVLHIIRVRSIEDVAAVVDGILRHLLPLVSFSVEQEELLRTVGRRYSVERKKGGVVLNSSGDLLVLH